MRTMSENEIRDLYDTLIAGWNDHDGKRCGPCAEDACHRIDGNVIREQTISSEGNILRPRDGRYALREFRS